VDKLQHRIVIVGGGFMAGRWAEKFQQPRLAEFWQPMAEKL